MSLEFEPSAAELALAGIKTGDVPKDRWLFERIADAAEASGHGSILVIAGDRALLVDVPGRRFEGELLEAAGRRPAVLGTAGHRLAGPAGPVHVAATHTTPEVTELVRLMARHRSAGGDACPVSARRAAESPSPQAPAPLV